MTRTITVSVSVLEDFIGKKLFIRTVTNYMTGRVEKIIGGMFELSDAAWIADTGRFMQAIKNGELNEVEPVGQCWVALGSIVDVFPWNHDLPTKQK